MLQLVWYKRDLRVHDHAPLSAAAAAGRVLPVFVHEPELLAADDHDPRHAAFVRASLDALGGELAQRGAPLLELHGRLPDVFEMLSATLPIVAIHAHEETGNAISYARDRRVRAWAKQRGLPLLERPTNGVVRRLPSRDGWHAHWVAQMRAPITAPPLRLEGVTDDEMAGVPPSLRHSLAAPTPAAGPDYPRVPCSPRGLTVRQFGGRDEATTLLQSFLHQRGEQYRRAMSSPLSAVDACSRLSPHFTWGTLSVREAYQAARQRARELRDAQGMPAGPPPFAEHAQWLQSLTSFASRLEWRDHFVQKLESEPALEHTAYSSLYDHVWPHEADAERLAVWREGRTGYPLVDACMRSLHATGWLTFRMRALVTSFATHYLWLPWRPVGLVLARLFTDYEPGIHWSQCQMQAGCTGINTIRIYNPVKQAMDHDPQGEFVRRWVPELAGLPTPDLLRPWDTPRLVQDMAGVRIGHDYPLPVVAHDTAYRHARDTLHRVKLAAQRTGEAERVWRRHGSRRTPLNHRQR